MYSGLKLKLSSIMVGRSKWDETEGPIPPVKKQKGMNACLLMVSSFSLFYSALDPLTMEWSYPQLRWNSTLINVKLIFHRHAEKFSLQVLESMSLTIIGAMHPKD